MKNLETLLSLEDIFDKKIFRIPDYQRGYAWQEKQLIEFWKDLENLQIDKPHYTGTLSLKKVGEEEYVLPKWRDEQWLLERDDDKKYTGFYVIDGQQRLTTIIIFIQEIINFIETIQKNNEIENLNLPIYRELKEKYLVISKPPNYIINTYKFGYEVDNPSFKYLRHEILGEKNDDNLEKTFYTLNLKTARDFFKKKINESYEKFGITKIDELFNKISKNLKFNLFVIQNDFDVFTAFETINNRGKMLSKLELLKNRLIYLVSLYPEKELPKDERLNLREEINEAWKQIYHQLGKNEKMPLKDDDFLKDHWIIYFGYTSKKDYSEFLLNEKFVAENIIKNEKYYLSPLDIKDYVSNIKCCAVHWYDSFFPKNNSNLSDQEALWLDRINRAGIASFRPLIVASLMSEKNQEMRIALFEEIERFIFVNFGLTKVMSTHGKTLFSLAAKNLSNGKKETLKIIEEIKLKLNEWAFDKEGFFSYSIFENYLKNWYKKGNGFYEWGYLKYFLYEYENYLLEKLGTQKIDWEHFTSKQKRDYTSIEHILPQTPKNTYWLERFGNYSDSELNILRGSLGNLLPLSQSVNSSFQNKSYLEKRNIIEGGKERGYVNGSHSEIEVANNYEEWNANSILDRGLKLLAFIEERWNIKFKDINEKIKFLHLEFLK